MNTTTFDTHFYVKKLQSKGMSEEQAEVVVEAIKESRAESLSNLVSKPEVERFKSELSSDMKLLEKSFKSEIGLLDERIKGELNLIKWTMGLNITLSISILLKIFFA